jgi:uncharacterized protein DUF1810
MLRRQSALDCEFPNMAALERFVTAQDAAADGIEASLAELGSGRRRSHWIWYGFPQLAGLGHSPMAERYALGCRRWSGGSDKRDYVPRPSRPVGRAANTDYPPARFTRG